MYPIKKNTESVPYFSVSFLITDLDEKNGKLVPREIAKPLNLDFHIKTFTKQNSANVAHPIWDGRVYEEENSIIIGGYSAKFSERPVGEINSRGKFIPQLEGADSKEFPLLKIPAEQIVFDPFEFKLLNVMPGNDEAAEYITNSFLPIQIYGQRGELLNNISFEIENQTVGSPLVLYAIYDGKKLEIASCSLKKSEIVTSREGYQPELIEGCTQPANGKVITLTYKGEFSKNILAQNNELYLSSNLDFANSTTQISTKPIKIDGDFQDWRNIPGVQDIEGDHVSYLFKNPDTDLLEFKVTNDDKYLYMYSRVAGAHGKTGKTGRYYWYSFIDVDCDATTGYSPSRDDNCYFGIPIGDDCEAQFEFIGNRFVKTFFGFTGIGAEKEALSGELTLGPSFYAQKGREGIQRESYKTEYVNRENSRFITHDYTEGTSEDIIVALSPDGSEVEVKVEMAGFLKNKSGKLLMYPGLKIDIAIGVEGSSDH